MARPFPAPCSCPAFEDWDFCKHLVAVALTANEAESLLPSDQAIDRGGATSRVLVRHSRPRLSPTRLLKLARREGALWPELDAEAAIATGNTDEEVLDLLRDAIDTAMDTDGGVNWRGAGELGP